MYSLTLYLIKQYHLIINQPSYPNSEATEKAKTFNAETDYSTGVAPTYNNGDEVWIYRKRLKKWVAAEVADNRQVMVDGCYLISLDDGRQVEGYNQTLYPRVPSHVTEVSPLHE